VSGKSQREGNRKEIGMTGKTLIGVAVASTFGWTAAAHAAPNHQAWVAAGDEQYPPMVMFEGRSADTFASTSATGEESVGSASKDGATATRQASAGETWRAIKARMKRPSTRESEWVASGEERYPTMVMFEGLNTDTLASTAPEELASTSPDAPAGTPTETSELVGSTGAAPTESVGAALPTEAPTDPSLSTGTDMHKGKEGIRSETNPDAPDVAADGGVSTEQYVATWTPATSTQWEVYVIPLEPGSETQASTSGVDSAVTGNDVTQPSSDSSSAGELTAAPAPTNEENPG